MQVPLAQETQQVNVPGRFSPPNPEIRPVGAEASGSNIGAAIEKVGGAVEGAGEQLGRHIQARQDFENTQKVNDAANAGLDQLKQVHDDFHQLQGGQVVDKYSGPTQPQQVNYPATAPGKLDISGGMAAKYTPAQNPIPSDSWIGQKNDIRNLVAKGLPPELATNALKIYDNGAEILDRSVRTHFAQQDQVYREQAIDSRIKTGASIFAVNPFDPNADTNALNKALSDRKSLSAINGEAPEKMAEGIQNVYDTFTGAAAQYNPANAGVLLDKYRSNLSVAGQQQLTGAKMDFDSRLIYNSSDLKRLPDGTPDLDDAREKINAIPGYTEEQQTKVFDMLEQRSAEDYKITKDTNDAKRRAFDSFANQPGVSIDDKRKAIASDQYAPRLVNGVIDHSGVSDMDKYLDNISRPPRIYSDPETVMTLQNQADNGVLEEKDLLAAYNSNLISFTNYQRLHGESTRLLSAPMKSALSNINADIVSTYPGDSTQQKEHELAFRAWLGEKKITDPVQTQKLYQDFKSEIPDGAKVFGMFSRTTEKGDVITGAQKDLALTKALGGIDKTVSFFSANGGIDRFAPDSPDRQAAITLGNRGWTGDNITPDVLEKFLKKYPNGK